MEDHAKLERLLNMLLSLNSKYGRSIKELSENFGISQRTVYRYIETIRHVGYVVDRIKEGDINYFYINKEESKYRDISELLHFSEEEAFIVNKAIHSIDDENEFKHNLIQKLYSIYDNDRVTTPIIRKAQSDTIQNITKAMNHKEQILLKNYKSSHGNNIRNRLVEPFGFTVNFISVWCYDTEDRSNKLFKTSRIGNAEPTGEAWQFEPEHKKGNLDIFRISSYEWIPVKLTLSLLACNLLLEEYPLAEKYITRQNDNTYLLKTKVAGFHGVGRFVMGLPGEITIHHPQALKDFIQEKIKKLRL